MRGRRRRSVSHNAADGGSNGRQEGSDDGNPARILRFVRNRPGASLQRVAEGLDLGHTTVRYHVTRLTAQGRLKRVREGREVRLFLDDGDLLNRIAPVVRDPDRERILEYLADNPVPHLTINRIATDLGLEFGFVKRTLEHLVNLDVLEMERIMGRYHLQEVEDIAELLDRVR